MDAVNRSEFVPAELIWTEPAVAMLTAPNPGPKTLEGTHTYVIGVDPAYIVDPGPEIPRWQDALVRWLEQQSSRPRAILLTHGHPDHAPSALPLSRALRIPVLGSAAIAETAGAGFHLTRPFHPGESFDVTGDRLIVLATPGHSPDHVAFWLEGARILFAGDTILGRGTSLVAPPEGDMARYVHTLERLRDLQPRLIAPGHGPVVTDPAAKIDEYVRHRLERERQILQLLQEGPSTTDDLVRVMYVGIDPRLHNLARGSVLAQLAKLVGEGRVTSAGEQHQISE